MLAKKVRNILKDLIKKGKEMRDATLPRCKSSNPLEKGSASKKSKKGSRSHSPLTMRGPTRQNENVAKNLHLDPYIESQIKSTILSQRSEVKWDDVVGLEKAKAALQEAVIYPLKYPHQFPGLLGSRKGILLYGVTKLYISENYYNLNKRPPEQERLILQKHVLQKLKSLFSL